MIEIVKSKHIFSPIRLKFTIKKVFFKRIVENMLPAMIKSKNIGTRNSYFGHIIPILV